MPLPDFEETTEIHTRCPFCSGEYVKKAGSVSHSTPVCAEFSEKTGSEFLKIANIAHAQKDSHP